jgi:tRNA-dihydrouridine synthase 2
MPFANGSTGGRGRAVAVVDYEKDPGRMASAKLRRKHDGQLPPLLLRIDRELERGRLVCQLGTGDPDLALRAALVVHRDVAAIDVNMGCPKRFSTAGGMGSALLQDPQRACDIVRKLDSHLRPLHLPVSAKVRLLSRTGGGGGALATVEFCSALIGAGASAIAIHGRTVGDPDVVDADRGALREVVSVLAAKFPSVPICANGDFYTRSEFEAFIKETNASAVLLARPALYNASIFVKPAETAVPAAADSPYGYDSPLLLDRTAVVQEYVRHAVRYDAPCQNVKYVVCEMLNVRRTPTSRVLALTARDRHPLPHPWHPAFREEAPHRPRPWKRPTVGQTCACKSLEAICALWNVPVPDAPSRRAQDRRGGAGDGDLHPPPPEAPNSLLLLPEPNPAGEPACLDSYLLPHADASSPPGLPNSSDADPRCGNGGATHDAEARSDVSRSKKPRTVD